MEFEGHSARIIIDPPRAMVFDRVATIRVAIAGGEFAIGTISEEEFERALLVNDPHAYDEMARRWLENNRATWFTRELDLRREL